MPEPIHKYIAAVVQHPPVFLDRDATVRRACALIAEAAAEGARIVAFPESYVPGYPGWVFGAAGWDDPVAKRLHAQLAANSLEVGGEALGALQSAADEHRVHVVMGATERDTRFSRGSLYNSLFFLADDGELLGVHRKLMPTHAERLVWTPAADASALRSYATGIGRLGGLICWEHWMPITRFALHATGEQVHVAAWPEVPEMHQIAARHYAFEGRCFVLFAGQLLRVDDLPADPDLRNATLGLGDLGGSDEMVLPGGSGIIGPDGNWVVGPAPAEPTIVYGEIDLDRILEEQLALDSAGHYHRPDIFSVSMHAGRRDPLVRLYDTPSPAETPNAATQHAADQQQTAGEQ
jgi:nitrilase